MIVLLGILLAISLTLLGVFSLALRGAARMQTESNTALSKYRIAYETEAAENAALRVANARLAVQNREVAFAAQRVEAMAWAMAGQDVKKAQEGS
jgi:hypothetical protein